MDKTQEFVEDAKTVLRMIAQADELVVASGGAWAVQAYEHRRAQAQWFLDKWCAEETP